MGSKVFLEEGICLLKNLKKFTDVLSNLLYLHIEFQDQIHRNERAVKRQNF
jgi:hypothetical protein